MRIAVAQINPIVGSLEYNAAKIVSSIDKARREEADLVVFPEMALCGYPPKDLLLLPSLIFAMEEKLQKIIESTKDIVVVLGLVRKNPYGGEKNLFNSAAIIQNRVLVGFQDKILLPDYDVFSERRYFEPGSRSDVWGILGKRIGITICEDIWQHAEAVEYTSYSRDPILDLQKQAPDVILNLSASPFFLNRFQTRLRVCRAAAESLGCPLVFCNQVGGNDSLIFDGYSFIVNAEGNLIHLGAGFKEDFFVIDLDSKKSVKVGSIPPMEELFRALVLGTKDYFHKLGFKKACLGLSGGIDSAVVACIATEALGKENLIALSLPSRYTSPESKIDARELAERLGIHFEEISIEEPFQAFLDLLKPHFLGTPEDTTEENLQARIRGMILMAFSNKFGYLVLAAGNKSELAMGYSTLYGDMCGGLEVLGDVIKEDVYNLAKWINQEREIIPKRILEKAPSAELRPNQKDTDTLPEYAIVDAVLKNYVEEHHSPEEIAKMKRLPLDLVKDLVRKIHLNEYKRYQAPPDLRVTKKSFAVGRDTPIVQHWNLK